jgi:hypothetical protein
MLCSRSWAGRITWDVFHQIKQRQSILRPKLYLPYWEFQATASGDPVGAIARCAPIPINQFLSCMPNHRCLVIEKPASTAVLRFR